MKALGALLLTPLLSVGGNAHAFDLPPLFGGAPQQGKTILRWSPQFEDSLHREQASLSLPLYQDDETLVSFGAKGSWLDFTDAPAPLDDLYDVQGSLTYSRNLADGGTWGATVAAQSASDQPFADRSVSAGNVTGFYAFKPAAKHQWSLFLVYSTRRTFGAGIPLPGFAYSYFPTPDFRAVFGLPFGFIRWKFAERWTFSGFVVLPVTARGSIGYTVFGPAQIYLGAEFVRQNFWLKGRANEDERLFFDDSRVFLGARSPISRVFYLEIEAGLALDRRFGQSTETFARWKNAQSLGGGFTSRLGVTASF